jgi:hypothetical protein
MSSCITGLKPGVNETAELLTFEAKLRVYMLIPQIL